jgi:regulatory protein
VPFARKSAKPRPVLDEAGLFAYAVKALGRQMRSEADLRRLMKARAAPDAQGAAAVATVLARLKEYGYLNDATFAETYARLRKERVRQDLQHKGIQADLITETLDAGYAQTDEAALARAHLERKRIPKPETPKETARVMRRLVAAGFSTSVIYKVLRQWDVPEESFTELDDVADESVHGPGFASGEE